MNKETITCECGTTISFKHLIDSAVEKERKEMNKRIDERIKNPYMYLVEEELKSLKEPENKVFNSSSQDSKEGEKD